MPGLRHPPIEETAKEGPRSALDSRRSTVARAGSPTGRGARSPVTSSRGGRRQVRARLHPRTNSAATLGFPGLGSPPGAFANEFTRTGAGGYLFPVSPSHHGERNASMHSIDRPISRSSSSTDPSTRAPTQRHGDDDSDAQREQQQCQERLERQQDREARMTAKKEAMASLLADPDRHRRAVAIGSSNPLHVWDHETAFMKSHYFSSTRRDNEKKYQNQKEQAEKYFVDNGAPEKVAGSATLSRASSDQSPNFPKNVTDGRLLSDSNGHGGSRSSNDSNENDFGGLGSYKLPSAGNFIVEKSDTWSTREHYRTRNMNALHAFSWDQRVFLPQRQSMLSPVFDLFSSPRFWEKLDWAIRGSVLTILPTLILCLEPATQHIFPLPTSVVFLAYWTTQPTFGAGLRETFIVLKGFSISFVILVVIIAINPGSAWVTLIILFCCLLVTGFAAEQVKRMAAYCFSSLLMQYIAQPQNTGYDYVGRYYATVLIGQGFGLASFLFPYIRWSSENARRYIVITGDAVSLSVHGACCSFWVEGSLLERQLHVARLRQLRHTIEASTIKAQQGLSEMGYEPHSGVYSTRLKTRMAFLKDVFNVVQSMTLVIEQVAANPALVETPMCREFGGRIRGELNLIAAAMDSIILRIVDLDNLVSVTDMTAFRLARMRYEEAVSNVRDEVILSNPDYHTDNSDILLGFFLFSMEELMEMIGNFQDTAKPPSNLWYFLTFPLRDLQSCWSAFADLYNAFRIRRSITRRLKEAIKLSVCIIVAAVFQVYAMKSSSTSPVAGVEIIPFVYRATGGESFQYSTMRMLGTVLGSLTGLLTVQIAQGHRPTLYGCTLVLTFIGSYVQAAPNYDALGNALANSVVSVVLQYGSQPNAMTRIQQNCFAILIYFIISSFIWPVRGRTKVNTGLDVSLRMSREAMDRLLRNLDLPDSATAVSADVLAIVGEMQKKVGQQLSNIPGAIAEPTLDSIGFPEMPWRMLVGTQQKLVATLFMMRHAYHTFMTSTIADVAGVGEKNDRKVVDNADMIGTGPVAATSISVHWVVLHRISPHTRHLSQLFYEAIEVYLLTLSKATFVPTTELTRLRLGMMQCYDRIVAVYIETIQHELNTSDGDEASNDQGNEDNDNSTECGNTQGNSKIGNALTRAPLTGSRSGLSGGSGAMALQNVAGFVPPLASTFAPHPTTVGGAADEPDAFRNNGSSYDVRSTSVSGLRNNSSGRMTKNSTFSGGSFRRSNSGTTGTRTSSKKGIGRLSYKLTPEERQRLWEYVLGPNSAGLKNASFFTNAALLAAAEQGGGGSTAATVPLPTSTTNNDTSGSSNRGPPLTINAANTASLNNAYTTGTNLTNQAFTSGFRSNHSVFNAAGSFWSRNVNALDPDLVRNAGVVLQEPVYEEPRQRRDGGESGARSSHRSLRNSFMLRNGGCGGNNSGSNQQQGRRSFSTGADQNGNDNSIAAELDALPAHSGEGNNIKEVQPIASDQLYVRSDDEGITGPPRQHYRSSNSSGNQYNSPSSRSRSLFTGRAETDHSMLLRASSPVHRSQGLVMKKSKTAKYAVPSVLQMSMVLPAGASALRNPEAAATALGGGAGASASDCRPPPPSSTLSIAVPAASLLDPPSPHSDEAVSPGTAATGSFSTQQTRLPNAKLINNGKQSFVSAGAGTTSAAAGDVLSSGRTAARTMRSHNPCPSAGLTAGSRMLTKKGYTRDWETARFTEEPLRNQLSPRGWDCEGRSARAASDAPTAAPSMGCTPAGATGSASARSTVGVVGPADLVSCGSHDPFEGEVYTGRSGRDRSPNDEALDAVGSGLLSDPLQLHGGSAANKTNAEAPGAPENLLPSPIPAPSLENQHMVNKGATHPFFSNSFSATGPVIPDALKDYVEGLAEQQRQQVPPPPAILGNASFINVMSNLPVANRSFLNGINNKTATAGNVFNGTFAELEGAGLGNSNAVQSNSGTLSSGGAVASAPLAVENTNTGAPTMTLASVRNVIQADFKSVVSKLELNNGTFCGPIYGNSRSLTSGARGNGNNNDGGSSGGGAALLSVLDVGGANGDSDGGGEEYVLTNSDIHSLEAFLFGLRAVITQVEELERYLLEVVHDNEMAAKL